MSLITSSLFSFSFSISFYKRLLLRSFLTSSLSLFVLSRGLIFSSFLSFSHNYLPLRFFPAFFFSFSISDWSQDLAAFRIHHHLFPQNSMFLSCSTRLCSVVHSRFEEGLFFCIANQNFCFHSKRVHLFHSKMNSFSRIFANTSVRSLGLFSCHVVNFQI
ncbi:unnamed protein product [Acanthosepion pharaonis]|uniref:Uncharacterized protein n=1 Tax=Acanthosepion pharaonis TaxID=158019 RepID=A0A812CIZ2_ACAPH|nr:unnamed protein product [Sepia pharaonis]